MKKRVIKLRESDLERLVNKILKEDMGGMDDGHPVFGDLNFSLLSPEEKEEIARYFSGRSKKSDYRTDDGDLEYGTFDDEPEELEESEKWIQNAINNPGSLKRKMGVHKGETIPSEKMSQKLSTLRKKDEDPNKKGIQGLDKDDLKTYRQIMLAKKLKKFKS